MRTSKKNISVYVIDSGCIADPLSDVYHIGDDA